MDTIKPLFTATATATGGRNGHTASDDGMVSVDLSVPKGMGGPGKPDTATPEHLFAAGYAACFGGALDFIGKQAKKDASKAKITAAVSIGPRDGGGFGLAVKLTVEDKSLPQAELAALAKDAHEKIWPLFACHARQCRRATRRDRRIGSRHVGPKVCGAACRRRRNCSDPARLRTHRAHTAIRCRGWRAMRCRGCAP